MDKVGQAIAKAEAEKRREAQFQELIAKVDTLTERVELLVNALQGKPDDAPKAPETKKKG